MKTDLHDENLGSFMVVELCRDGADGFCKESKAGFAGFSVKFQNVR